MNFLGGFMTMSYLDFIKQRARDVITQPDLIPIIQDIPPAQSKFKYPLADADMSTAQLRSVMVKIETIALAETLDLFERVMVRH
jgi:hypothetical protein